MRGLAVGEGEGWLGLMIYFQSIWCARESLFSPRPPCRTCSSGTTLLYLPGENVDRCRMLHKQYCPLAAHM